MANRLEIKDPLKAFGITRMDSLKRKLNNFKYEIKGRGDKAILILNDSFDIFKFYMMVDYGFAANTDFVKLKDFCDGYFGGDRDYSIHFKKDIAEMVGVDEKTIGQWLQKFVDAGVIEKNVICSSIDPVYYTVYESLGQRVVLEITHEQYVMAWKEYWDAIKLKLGAEEALKRHYKVNGGKCYKIMPREVNLFNSINLLKIL